jgi:hypothetical protein
MLTMFLLYAWDSSWLCTLSAKKDSQEWLSYWHHCLLYFAWIILPSGSTAPMSSPYGVPALETET